MGKRINLIGQKFNKLTVVSDSNKRSSDNKRLWLCKCDCGNTTYATTTQLKTEKKKSCGCSHVDAAKRAAKVSANKRRGIIKKDLTGMKFGELTAIVPDYDRMKKDRETATNGVRTFWICRCSCGSSISVNASNLLNGNSQSCGCVKSRGEQKICQILSDNNIKFERQKIFDTCRFQDTGWVAYFDFYLPDYNILIEYDGDLHFKSANSGWNNEESFERTKQKDEFKNNWCKENGVNLIRIPYTHYDDICIEDLIGLNNNGFVVR